MIRLFHRSIFLKSACGSCLSLKKSISTHGNKTKKKTFSLQKQLYEQIKATGPISIADFMLHSLTHPDKGYYMRKDVFGEEGDFVTSPELSQMFGELLAVWVTNEWIAAGSPTQIQVVELGPGRGTLMDDMLRTFHSLKKSFANTKMSVHLVEISPFLSELQRNNLCATNSKIFLSKPIPSDNYSMQAVSKYGQKMYWHKGIEDVPKESFTFFVAHEFFDALPIHKFVKQDKLWKEMFVDICSESKVPKFRFVLMPHSTVAAQTLIMQDEKREHIEVSPKAGAIVHEIATRLKETGGAALIADYGHFGTNKDTLRGFKSHQVVDILSNMGESDITADVDFKFLKQVAESCDVATRGPVTQQYFLKNMGIDTRIMMLLRNCSSDEMKKKLIGSYDMLVNPTKMGEKFKFFSIVNKNRLGNEKTPLTAFE